MAGEAYKELKKAPGMVILFLKSLKIKGNRFNEGF